MRRLVSCIALSAGLLLGSASAPAAAATSFDFLFNLSHVDSDDDLFLNLTVGSYGYERVEIERALPRIRAVEADLPVILYLAKETGRSVSFIATLRSGDLSWSVIFGKLDVSVGALLGSFERDPGPPYGKAWGYWKKQPRSVLLSDAEIVDLVRIHVGSKLSGVPAHEIVQARARGKSVETMVADKKGRPHGKKPAHAAPAGKGNGKGPKKGH